MGNALLVFAPRTRRTSHLAVSAAPVRTERETSAATRLPARRIRQPAVQTGALRVETTRLPAAKVPAVTHARTISDRASLQSCARRCSAQANTSSILVPEPLANRKSGHRNARLRHGMLVLWSVAAACHERARRRGGENCPEYEPANLREHQYRATNLQWAPIARGDWIGGSKVTILSPGVTPAPFGQQAHESRVSRARGFSWTRRGAEHGACRTQRTTHGPPQTSIRVPPPLGGISRRRRELRRNRALAREVHMPRARRSRFERSSMVELKKDPSHGAL
jgi:hypothetical protein